MIQNEIVKKGGGLKVSTNTSPTQIINQNNSWKGVAIVGIWVTVAYVASWDPTAAFMVSIVALMATAVVVAR